MLENCTLRNKLEGFVFPTRSFSMIREYLNKNHSMISPWMRSYFVKYYDFDVAILLI